MPKKKIKHPDIEPANPGFDYVPAAICLDQYTIALYIRYHSGRKSNHMRIKQKSSQHSWIECPDRDLVIISHGFDVAGFNPDNFDKCLYFNLFDHTTNSQLGLKYVMPNFVHDSGARGSASSRRNGNKYPVGDPRRVTVIGDSGGFQYVSGKADWVNPVDLSHWYNDNVDAGMQLDIPITVGLDKTQIKQFADLQNWNTDIIRKHLKPHVELVNVIHGKTLEERLQYKDLIEEKHGDLSRMALGGMRSFGPLGLAHTLNKVIHSGKRYSQYHLLGITSSEIFPVLIAMGELGDNPPHITSDSSTHKMSANNRKQFMQYEVGKFRTYDIGLESQKFQNSISPEGTIKPNPTSFGSMVNNFFTCNCPVCTNVKYIDVLGMLNGTFTLTLLSIHNAIQNAQYVELVKEVCQTEDFETFVTWVKATHSSSNPSANKDLVSALDYLNIYKDSPKKAEEKYKGMVQRSTELYSGGGGASWKSQSSSSVDAKKNEYERLNTIRKTSIAKLQELESGKSVKSVRASTSGKKPRKKITGRH